MAAEAVRWGKRGARVNTISPSIIMTPLARDELNGPRGEAGCTATDDYDFFGRSSPRHEAALLLRLRRLPFILHEDLAAALLD